MDTRVADSQAQAAAALRLTVAFAAAAAVAAMAVAGPDSGGSVWLPLHLFLVGGIGTAIAGVTPLLAVTWSAAPAPSARTAATTRWAIAVGAVTVAAGRELSMRPVAGTGGLVVITGLVLLGRSLLVVRRRGLHDRFHPAIDAYLAGIGCALAGSAIGVLMVVLEPTSWDRLRAAHATLNLLGLVGIVIAGTLPYFLATQARTRMGAGFSGRRLRGVTAVLVTGVGLAVAGLLLERPGVAAAGRVTYATGLLVLVRLLPRIQRSHLRWAGPRLLQLGAGVLWWIAATVLLAVGDVGGPAPDGDPLLVLVVGGFAQILVGALAYLGPVLRGGGHERLSAGFRATASWSSLAAGNVAGTALFVGAGAVALVAVLVWTADLAVRTARLLVSRDLVPPEPGARAGRRLISAEEVLSRRKVATSRSDRSRSSPAQSRSSLGRSLRPRRGAAKKDDTTPFRSGSGCW